VSSSFHTSRNALIPGFGALRGHGMGLRRSGWVKKSSFANECEILSFNCFRLRVNDQGLLIGRMTKKAEGTYVCNVSQRNFSVRKTFYVQVNPKPEDSETGKIQGRLHLATSSVLYSCYS